MENENKTKEQLIVELAQMRQRVADLEAVDTERKRAGEALRESEERYRDLVEHSFDLICTHDLQGQILSVNPTAEKVIGYAVEQLVGTNLRDYLPPDVRDQFDDYLAEIEREGEASGLMRMVTRSGEQRIWEYHNSLRVEGVRAPMVRGTARDITERKRAEEALRRAHAQNKRLLESIPSILIGLDENDRITQWSTAAENLFDVTAADAIGRPFQERIIGDIQCDWERVFRGVSECREKNDTIRLDDVHFRCPDGEERLLGITINPIKGDHHSTRFFLIWGGYHQTQAGGRGAAQGARRVRNTGSGTDSRAGRSQRSRRSRQPG
jgi:PAS domain S-box-containing protein